MTDQTAGAGDMPAKWDREADVVVLGFGAAGCAAAIEAHDSGARVLVLEKMSAGREGGSTRISGGIWFENTDREGCATYLRNLCGEYPIPEDIIEVWSKETYENTAWLERLGVHWGRHADYRPEYPELSGSEFYGGYLGVNGQMGNGLLWEALTGSVSARGVEVLLDTPAERLVQDQSSGAVVGVIARQAGQIVRVRARQGVVLATGGFENNPEMVRDYLGIPGTAAVWGSPGNTGDGIKMALKVGADLWHMDNMMAVNGIKVPGYEAGFFVMFTARPGFIFIGLDGTRFVNEVPQVGHGQAYLHGSYELFPTRPMHVLFDEETRLAGPVSPGPDLLPVGWNLLIEQYEWSKDNSAEIEKGWIYRADTLKELAVRLNVDPDVLHTTVARYNEACELGVDSQFGRDPSLLAPMLRPPYYAYTWGPLLGWSCGGPRRNASAQVLDAFGQVIPRLYAAGNVSSTYSWCKDGGFFIADALAFGRVAGRTAAHEDRLDS
jgi:succinate dehydrogenase/fumarate reductase flavoprotein subunit